LAGFSGAPRPRIRISSIASSLFGLSSEDNRVTS
jgi:hypothetical protein